MRKLEFKPEVREELPKDVIREKGKVPLGKLTFDELKERFGNGPFKAALKGSKQKLIIKLKPKEDDGDQDAGTV